MEIKLSVPIPLWENDNEKPDYFRNILSGHSSLLSIKYLDKLSKEREKMSDKYVEALFVLVKYLEHSTDPYISEGKLAQFKWKGCDGKVYSSSCIRFELIMSAMNRGIMTLNSAEVDFSNCLKLINGIAIEEVLNWSCRNEIFLPLESCLIGCEIYRSITMTLSQAKFLEAKEAEEDSFKWGHISVAQCYYLWLYEESYVLHDYIEARKQDGSGVHLEGFSDVIEYHMKNSYCNYLYYSCMVIEDQKKYDPKETCKRILSILNSARRFLLRQTGQKEFTELKSKINSKIAAYESYADVIPFSTKPENLYKNITPILPKEERKYHRNQSQMYTISTEKRAIVLWKKVQQIK